MEGTKLAQRLGLGRVRTLPLVQTTLEVLSDMVAQPKTMERPVIMDILRAMVEMYRVSSISDRVRLLE